MISIELQGYSTFVYRAAICIVKIVCAADMLPDDKIVNVKFHENWAQLELPQIFVLDNAKAILSAALENSVSIELNI